MRIIILTSLLIMLGCNNSKQQIDNSNGMWKYDEGEHFGDVINGEYSKGDTIIYNDKIGIITKLSSSLMLIESNSGESRYIFKD